MSPGFFVGGSLVQGARAHALSQLATARELPYRIAGGLGDPLLGLPRERGQRSAGRKGTLLPPAFPYILCGTTGRTARTAPRLHASRRWRTDRCLWHHPRSRAAPGVKSPGEELRRREQDRPHCEPACQQRWRAPPRKSDGSAESCDSSRRPVRTPAAVETCLRVPQRGHQPSYIALWLIRLDQRPRSLQPSPKLA